MGQRIAALREEKAMTQVQLAKKAGISPSTLSLIESGRVERPQLGTIRKISQALEVDPRQLTREPTSTQAVYPLTSAANEYPWVRQLLGGHYKEPPTPEEWARLMAQFQALLRDVHDLQRGIASGEVSEGFAWQRVTADVETLERALAQQV